VPTDLRSERPRCASPSRPAPRASPTEL
jgi:hypothetical protein